ncbi:MAG: Bacterial regulatory protein tetR family [Chloroflexota bacterium]|jgi:AcrR family transcriptional regulator|nr:Bacterial regulatory protein tetR family [Chloroflexota bacterium]
MTRIANEAGRAYRSALRAEQAEATRARILDATIRVIAGGLAYVSIPAVAREAGVSVPTVYRHFATKRDLLAAVYPHSVRGSGLDKLVRPHSMDELLGGLRTYFERTDSLGDLARLAMASPGADEVRALNMPERLAMFRRIADSVDPRPSEADLDRIARLLVVLTASSALRLWRDQLGSSVDEVADDVDWVIRAVIASATSRNRS